MGEATSKTAEALTTDKAGEVKQKAAKETGSSTVVKRWQNTWLSEFSYFYLSPKIELCIVYPVSNFTRLPIVHPL